MNQDSLQTFGNFIIKQLFDRGLHRYGQLARHELQTVEPDLQSWLDERSPEDQKMMKKVVLKVLLSATHDFLFALEEEADFERKVSVLVDQNNVADLSDGLQGELFLEEGWINRYSEFRDDARSLIG